MTESRTRTQVLCDLVCKLTKTGLYKLADLIDRPTCAIVESYMGDNLESVEETPHHVLSCGHIAYGEDDPMFCPVCGAAVTDDYR